MNRRTFLRGLLAAPVAVWLGVQKSEPKSPKMEIVALRGGRLAVMEEGRHVRTLNEPARHGTPTSFSNRFSNAHLGDSTVHFGPGWNKASEAEREAFTKDVTNAVRRELRQPKPVIGASARNGQGSESASRRSSQGQRTFGNHIDDSKGRGRDTNGRV